MIFLCSIASIKLYCGFQSLSDLWIYSPHSFFPILLKKLKCKHPTDNVNPLSKFSSFCLLSNANVGAQNNTPKWSPQKQSFLSDLLPSSSPLFGLLQVTETRIPVPQGSHKNSFSSKLDTKPEIFTLIFQYFFV